MNRPSFRLLSIAALAGFFLLLPACDKASDPQTSPAPTATELSAQYQPEPDRCRPSTEAATPNSAAEADNLDRLAGRCLTRTYDAATRTLTLDFGPTNFIGPNGVARTNRVGGGM